jgi:hypothetical protein
MLLILIDQVDTKRLRWRNELMLTLDSRVELTCTENEQIALATILRIQGNRVDVALDQGGGDIIISMVMQKPGLYVGSRSGLEFTMRT